MFKVVILQKTQIPMKIIKHTLKDAPIIDIVKGHLELWVGGFGLWTQKDEKFVKTKTLFFF